MYDFGRFSGQRIALPTMTNQPITSTYAATSLWAGRSDTLFYDDTAHLIHQTSRGRYASLAMRRFVWGLGGVWVRVRVRTG